MTQDRIRLAELRLEKRLKDSWKNTFHQTHLPLHSGEWKLLTRQGTIQPIIHCVATLRSGGNVERGLDGNFQWKTQDYGYVLETGKISLEGTASFLSDNRTR